MLSSDIKKEKPGWSIWDDGLVYRVRNSMELLIFVDAPLETHLERALSR